MAVVVEDQREPNTDKRFQEFTKEYAELTKEKRRIEGREKEINSRIKELDGIILDYYQQMGLQRMTINGVTIYLSEEIWAGGAKIVGETGEEYTDRQLTCRALIDAGYPDFVKPDFNVMTLSAWVRELDRDNNGNPILPVELVGKMGVTRSWKLKGRMA